MRPPPRSCLLRLPGRQGAVGGGHQQFGLLGGPPADMFQLVDGRFRDRMSVAGHPGSQQRDAAVNAQACGRDLHRPVPRLGLVEKGKRRWQVTRPQSNESPVLHRVDGFDDLSCLGPQSPAATKSASARAIIPSDLYTRPLAFRARGSHRVSPALRRPAMARCMSSSAAGHPGRPSRASFPDAAAPGRTAGRWNHARPRPRRPARRRFGLCRPGRYPRWPAPRRRVRLIRSGAHRGAHLDLAEPGTDVPELAQRDACRLMRNRRMVRVWPPGQHGTRPAQRLLRAGQSERQQFVDPVRIDPGHTGLADHQAIVSRVYPRSNAIIPAIRFA